jgi:hypothetical protein
MESTNLAQGRVRYVGFAVGGLSAKWNAHARGRAAAKQT